MDSWWQDYGTASRSQAYVGPPPGRPDSAPGTIAAGAPLLRVMIAAGAPLLQILEH